MYLLTTCNCTHALSSYNGVTLLNLDILHWGGHGFGKNVSNLIIKGVVFFKNICVLTKNCHLYRFK